MASISGIIPGYKPQIIEATVRREKPAKVKPEGGVRKKEERYIEYPCACDGCGYIVASQPDKRAARKGTTPFVELVDEKIYCGGCINMFNMLYPFGEHPSIEDAQRTFDRLKANDGNMVIILKSQSFGAPGGVSISVDFGDVFTPSRIGSVEPNGFWDGSKNYFSIDVMIGPYPLTLFPWEFGVLTWLEVMRLRDEKLYEECYVSSDDKSGYYRPTPAGKNLITNAFGER
jgi:hypothetical protein